MSRSLARTAVAVLSSLLFVASSAAQTASKYLAPGFSALPKDSRIAILPLDVELFSLSAGGVPEPRADWTKDALGHMQEALRVHAGKLGVEPTFVDERSADAFAEQLGLHAAVARSIELHHAIGGAWALPTKQGRLDWSFDDAMQPLQVKTGARYGLFVFVRDSYASAERKAAMVAMALLGVALRAGTQAGYASLVDLETGRVLWFNRLQRGKGDLRDAESATDSIEALLEGFPAVR